MDLQNKTVMILGGSGLVGQAVVRRLLPWRPQRIVLVALFEGEVTDAVAALQPEAGDTSLLGEWGNVFFPAEVAQRSRSEMLDSDELRSLVVGDLLGDFTAEVLERSYLHRLLDRYRPDAVVDCINTATAFAYQDVFRSARELLAAARERPVTARDVEEHILTLAIPQLIRHMQIAVESMARNRTRAYVKIGTSGTGGMGFNIPYTHSEERPSRTLLSKSAMAGAQSLLLFLLGRTPGGPATKEIKPTAAIAWRRIAYGPIRRAGREIDRYDCPEPLPLHQAFGPEATGWTATGQPVESVFIDVGENGVFARDEFETVTSLGQMEFITPEEVADYVVSELRGQATGRDIVAALDAATAGPTYTAGVLRADAIERLEALEVEHDVRSVAFEMLGPPRLTKMLYETFIWSRLRPSVRALAGSDPAVLAGEAERLLAGDEWLRSLIVSIGLPILLSGKKLYRGATVLVPVDPADLERAVARGWVDLRPENAARWIDRAQRVLTQSEERARQPDRSGSDRDWHAMDPDDPIAPARFARWVFRNEDDGERIKR